MTSQTPARAHLSRLAIAGAFLLTGLAGTAQAASAHGPLVDDGASGGGGSVASSPIFLEELGLVSTNDGPTVAISGPTLVGSGPDREIVSNSDHEQMVAEAEAEAAMDGPSLVGSGPDREIVANSDQQDTAGTLDETQRSIALGELQAGPETASGTLDETTRANDLIALSPTGYETAASHRGLPY